MDILVEVTGWTGAVTVLSAYLAVSMNWLRAGRVFQTANLLGACAFIINGASHEAWPSVATNIAWLLISAIALVRLRLAEKPENTADSCACAAESPAVICPQGTEESGRLLVSPNDRSESLQQRDQPS